MTKRFLIGLVAVLVTAWGMTTPAHAGESGTYSGFLGFHSVGTTTQLGDDFYWHGEFSGAFRNGEGSGFMHNATVICPGVLSSVGGVWHYEGNCIFTDPAGNRAIVEWRCTRNADGDCPGPLTWLGGTGKYEGISGEGSFVGVVKLGEAQGHADWKGEWKLP